MLVPPVVDTVTKQVAGIVAHIQIHIPLICGQVIDSVGDHLSDANIEEVVV